MAERVLLVDDDDFIRDMLKEMLSNHEVFEAENGAEAVEMYVELHHRHRPHGHSYASNGWHRSDQKNNEHRIPESLVVIGISAFSAVKGEDMKMAGARGGPAKATTSK